MASSTKAYIFSTFISYEGFRNIPEEEENQSDRGSSPEYPVFDRAQLLERYKVGTFAPI